MTHFVASHWLALVLVWIALSVPAGIVLGRSIHYHARSDYDYESY